MFVGERLSALDAELSATVVSGVFSGGNIAVQFHVVGCNRWADSSRLAVFNPQATSRLELARWPSTLAFNPCGCWGRWGDTGPLYRAKEGPPMIGAVMRKLARLGEPRSTPAHFGRPTE